MKSGSALCLPATTPAHQGFSPISALASPDSAGRGASPSANASFYRCGFTPIRTGEAEQVPCLNDLELVETLRYFLHGWQG
jgi:hypothetical protein